MDIDFVLGTSNKILLDVQGCSLIVMDENHDKEERLMPIEEINRDELTNILKEKLKDNYYIVNMNAIYNSHKELVKFITYIMDNENNIKKLSIRGMNLFDMLAH